MKQLLIYDLDGTLVDTREDITCAVNHMLKAMKRIPLSQEEVRRLVGRGLHQLIQGCLKTPEMKEIEKGAKLYRDYYRRHMLDYSRLYPGVGEFLEHFKDRRQAVITNKPNPFSRDILEGLGVAHYFAEIIPGDSTYAKKPSPEAIHFLLEKESIEKDAAVLIGDSAVDIETGRNAQVLTVVVRQGFSTESELQAVHPDEMVADFFELLTLAKKEKW